MKKLIFILVVLLISFSAFAYSTEEKGLNVGISISPYMYERLIGEKTYNTQYGAASRVDVDYKFTDHFQLGVAFIGTHGYFPTLECHDVSSYYGLFKIGRMFEVFEDDLTGFDVELGAKSSHLHPYSSAAFVVGFNSYYKYTINEKVRFKLSVDAVWSPDKGQTRYEDRLHSIAVIPYIGAEVRFK